MLLNPKPSLKVASTEASLSLLCFVILYVSFVCFCSVLFNPHTLLLSAHLISFVLPAFSADTKQVVMLRFDIVPFKCFLFCLV